MKIFEYLKKQYDLIVIGGGIIGMCSLYFATTKFNNWRTLLVEKGMIGQGATRYCVGLDYTYGSTAFKSKLTEESHNLWLDINKKMNLTSMKSQEIVGIISTEKVPLTLEKITGQKPYVVESNTYNKQQYSIPLNIHRKYNLLTKWKCNIFQPVETIELLNRFCINSPNIEIVDGIKATGIQQKKGKFLINLDNQALTINAERCILAIGPWINSEFSSEMKYIGKNIRTKKIVSLHINVKPNKTDPVFFFFDSDAFLLPDFKNNRWIFSFTIYDYDIYPDSENLSISEENWNVGCMTLKEYCPDLVSKIIGGRVFCDAYSDNWEPIIKSYLGNSHGVIVTAGSGSGFRLAPAISKRAIESIY